MLKNTLPQSISPRTLIHPWDVEFIDYDYPEKSDNSPKGVIVTGRQKFGRRELESALDGNIDFRIKEMLKKVPFAVMKIDPQLYHSEIHRNMNGSNPVM